MEDQWYYVEAGERKGPVELEALKDLISSGALGDEDYVWTKGFENWVQLQEVEELQVIEEVVEETLEPEVHSEGSSVSSDSLRLQEYLSDENSVFIKIGADRGAEEVEYGPYSLEIIKKLYTQNRINAKTYIFVRGMQDWTMIADLEDFSEIFEGTPPPIEDSERRASKRKPFVARMYIENQKQVFVGVCRDISVGGMQVLVEQVPAKIGDSISINVHPENTEHHFVAGGTVVRLLDGGQGFSFRFTDLGEDAKEAIQSYLSHE